MISLIFETIIIAILCIPIIYTMAASVHLQVAFLMLMGLWCGLMFYNIYRELKPLTRRE